MFRSLMSAGPNLKQKKTLKVPLSLRISNTQPDFLPRFPTLSEDTLKYNIDTAHPRDDPFAKNIGENTTITSDNMVV